MRSPPHSNLPPTPLEAIERILIETLLPAEAQAQFATGAIGAETLRPIANHITELSARYTSRRGIAIDSVAAATAYALYYTPINAAKILHLLSRPGIVPPETTPLRVLDYGAGPGTGALALVAALNRPLEIVAVDASPAMRTVASRLLERARLSRSVSAPPVTWRVETDFVGHFDLIVAANVLNELPEEPGAARLERLSAALTDSGTLITLEPALLEATQAHMRARDSLLTRHPDLTPIFPCTQRDSCPMVRAEPTNWCHGSLTWNAPQIVRQLDALTGFNKHRTKYSAFVFRRGAALQAGLRIVSPVEKSGRGVTATGCGPGFYGPIILPKRNRTDANRVFGRIDVYDRVTIDPFDPSGVIAPSASVLIAP
jgi:ribosomal protein RSM22 (predicted rRNA methylase)